ncbi:MAG: DNA-3-methyladenine glycosylase I [Bacteroidetes bacterium]|nr:MAG: DNA-3-methyladenine glycosylase I [Bacteroidota bacterium]RLD79944.1 MAG: DNA-3-methyladenine glycosylase I [Bacteroidota bacterium]
MKTNKIRCAWTANNPFHNEYHDTEWGVPLRNDQKLFEFLILDAFQAGLSWLTILKKRDNFRKAFDNFDPKKVALYNENKIQELLNNAGIIRNKLKVRSSITNARIFLKIQKEYGSFDKYIWQFVDHKPIINKWERIEDVPVSTKESDAMSIDLKKRGFKFVGTTICYAFMQAAGMVNDHTTDCFRYVEIDY